MVKGQLRKQDEPESCAMQLSSLSVLTALAIGVASCSQEQAGYTEKEGVCIAQHYKDYDAKRLSQCVDVCKACLSGTVATCNTS